MSRLLVSRFVVERIIERSPTSDVASSAAEALVAELAVHAVANVVEVKIHGSTSVDCLTEKCCKTTFFTLIQEVLHKIWPR